MTNVSSAQSPSSPHRVTVRAPAKVNLVLRVLDRRPDGFHNLWSLMQTVGLEDEVSIEVSEGMDGIRLCCDDPSLTTDRTNLVYRAAEAVMRRCPQSMGLDISLIKRIPMGAGLGGGSSDAAATIIGLNRLLNLRWSAAEMAQVGQLVGSDVPFFFFAPTAVVTGRGEDVMPVCLSGDRWLVLVNPGFSIETKWAYHTLSASRTEVRPLAEAHANLVRERRLSWESVLARVENDFEAPVFQTYPVLRTIKDRLLTLGAEAALLSGSGATMFGVFRDEQQARRAASDYPTQGGERIVVVSTRSGPVECFS
ncbi:MAG: 4-(cytidine 5'-diphospho)-2-C-methyl-D-erythritol kinase [Nitrospira sp.]|nr:4-(cytidine 5'-diphospho)-2-C-methyl-D-erythritol kinase [Nitrospira sp.]